MTYHSIDRVATVAFDREIARLADQETMAKGSELRQRYFEQVCSVVEDGVADGSFRAIDARLDTLFIFGSAQWAWTWFNPDGARSVE